MPRIETFEDWFNQIELYSFKSERFYDLLKLHRQHMVEDKAVVKWLEAAFEAGQESRKESK